MYSVCGKHHIRLTSLLELYFPQKIDKNDRENGINSRLYAHFLPYCFLSTHVFYKTAAQEKEIQP